jgi:hypothetical protein
MISRSPKGVEGVFPGGARVRKMLTILNAMVRDKRPFRFASIADQITLSYLKNNNCLDCQDSCSTLCWAGRIVITDCLLKLLEVPKEVLQFLDHEHSQTL